MRFDSKNMIVTGATGDLGRAITQRLVTEGANVLTVASHEGRLAQLKAEVIGPGRVETCTADISTAEQVKAYAKRAFTLWGAVDGFVNNAGIQTKVRPIVDFPRRNSTGSWRLTCAACSSA